MPCVLDVSSKRLQCSDIRRNAVIVVVPSEYGVQPPLLVANSPMLAPMDLREKCAHLRLSLLSARSTHKHGSTRSTTSDDVREAEKIERLRTAPAVAFAVIQRKTSESDHACLLGMKREPKLCESVSQRLPHRVGIFCMLEAHDEIVGVPHDVRFAVCMFLPP